MNVFRKRKPTDLRYASEILFAFNNTVERENENVNGAHWP
jgi:hypothetical protein